MGILGLMSKNTAIIAIIIAVIALAGGALAFSQINKKSAAPINTQQVADNKPAATEDSSTQKGTLQSLISSGKNVSCEINMPGQNGKGLTFVSGNKLRGDFTINSEGQKEMVSHILSDGTYMYMWTDGVTSGTKFKIDPDTPKPSFSPGSQTTDLNSPVDLKCSPWSVDNSKFIIPTNIKFSDMSQVINNAVKNQGSATPKVDKSICDQIQDPQAKAACLKALGN